MDTSSSELARRFLEHWRGAPRTAELMPLEVALTERLARGRERWPEVVLDGTRFAAWVGERAPDGDDPVAALRMLRTEDLYLCCACSLGEGAALRALEANYLARVPEYLASMRLPPQVVDAVSQELRTKLLVAFAGVVPKLSQYAGAGSLEGWLRVAAIRTALNLVQAEGRHAARIDSSDPAEDFIAAGADLELDFIKARYRQDFEAAFREALAALTTRDRNLLRFAFVESLTPGRIGALYKVHRTTAMRWLQAAEQALLADLRARLIARLGVSGAECDSLMAALHSRLSLTLSSLMPAQ